MAHATPGAYYIPSRSYWPLVGSLAMICTMVGAAHWINDSGGLLAKPLFFTGIGIFVVMLFGWFGEVIGESIAGRYNNQVDGSFRMGMMWFIFSEIMFFSAFFGALFYTRVLSVPWIGGEGHGALTNLYIWSGYTASWPTNGPGMVGGAFETIPAWGLPLVNTLLLLSSGVTITFAHHALRSGHRKALLLWLGATVLLGATFLYYQAHEYMEAYNDLNLTLNSGVYGSTFFMLTGFHGAHVILGTIMLTVMWFRCAKGHFTRDNHFGFEAVAWYWHFVDVVWLGLFVFVYVL